mmetsp:Transcript_15085/g.26505  ORF Transcript_15085/g.26505 Transcript_15085/m.26505 type:complete len:141 (-) Transcript_15085:840-1262(-)
MPSVQNVVKLMRRPTGKPVPGEDLVYVQAPMPSKSDLQDGQVLVKNCYLALDPAMRGWMRDQKSYIPPVKLGAIMRGSSVGQVVASKSKEFQVGDWVNCMIELGWCEYGVANGSAIQKITPLQNVPPRIYLGVLGVSCFL